MIIEIILLIITLTWLIFATISDIKTREIPDWLNYSLIAIALVLRSLMSLTTKNPSFIISSLICFAIVFAFSNFMYYSKQWGGGDAKLAMALSIVFASYPESLLRFFSPNLNIPFLLSLFINVLIAGAIISLFYSIYLSIKNKEKYLEEHRKITKNKKIRNLEIYLIIIFLVLSVLISFLVKDTILKFLFILILFFPILFTYLYIFVKIVEKVSTYKIINSKHLTEGDWIIHDIKINNKLIYSSRSPGVTKKQIEEIIKHKIQKVTVKEGMPFVPSFLIGLIITLIFGNIILPL